MKDKDIQELFAIVKSIEASKNNCKQKKNYEKLDFVVKRCEDFCREKSINITHGSAYRELKHKYYYYWDKYIAGIKDEKDLYGLYENKIISSKDVLERILGKK